MGAVSSDAGDLEVLSYRDDPGESDHSDQEDDPRSGRIDKMAAQLLQHESLADGPRFVGGGLNSIGFGSNSMDGLESNFFAPAAMDLASELLATALQSDSPVY